MHWRNISGLQAFEDYVVPTTPNTKNPLYRALGLPAVMRRVVGVDATVESLQKRVRNAYLYGSIHAVGSAISIFALGMGTAQEDAGGIALSTIGTLLNTYCVALQVDITSRIKRILAIKERRSASGK